jgi:transcriptional regulator with XRE-family HTH domain
MPNQSLESFGDFVRRTRRDKNLSCADVSKRSARFGPRIAASYINRIENEPTRRPTVDRLKALAHGLDIPVEELLARAAGLVPSDSDLDDAFRLAARFRVLSPTRKADVLMIVEMWYSQG